MSRVLLAGKYRVNREREITCGNCQAVMGYYIKELTLVVGSPYIKCLDCNWNIYVSLEQAEIRYLEENVWNN